VSRRVVEAYGQGLSDGVLLTFGHLAKAADKQPLTGDDVRRMLAAYARNHR
jgi:hypothetical protein